MPHPTAPLKPQELSYPLVSLVTNSWPAHLIASANITASAALPDAFALPDLVFSDRNAPREPQPDEFAGFLVWEPRPGSICELRPVIVGADNATVNALFGFYFPMQRLTPRSGDPVQWHAVPLALMVWTAGTKVGIAGGIVTEVMRYADTIAITRSFWPDPNPLRIVGPRTSTDDGTLLPDNTPVGIQFDLMGGIRPFLFLDLGTATGVNVLSRTF